MKKIMFNDRYGLTQAVLEGRKTMTRRIVKGVLLGHVQNGMPGMAVVGAPYKVGEVVAVAQAYRDMNVANDSFGSKWLGTDFGQAWRNKMFVKTEYMPHRIRITNVRVERLQDISDEDCIREGIKQITTSPYQHLNGIGYTFNGWSNRGTGYSSDTPRGAFAALIDKVSGKGTWESNPWVYVYEFELVNSL